jgi:tRNA (adenine37-N6)-methyltransferase
MTIPCEAIGVVHGGRQDLTDDRWSGVRATIELDGNRFSTEALSGLDAFSHVVVLYHFHKVEPGTIETESRHPRGNAAWPRVGIFAQRGKARPNRIGVSTCRLLAIDGLRLAVEGLDAIDGSPVLDLKPYVTGFAPRGEIREPEWARSIMLNYW